MHASTSFASLILALCFTAIFAYPPPDGCTGACATACVNNFTSCVSTCNGDFYCNMMTCLKPRTYPVDQCFWPLMIYTALASGNMYTDVALGPSQCTGNCATNCVNYWNSCIASCNGTVFLADHDLYRLCKSKCAVNKHPAIEILLLPQE
uniref:Uncharacterized protein n=1 Tax=Acrobeloides nanus TaxID=290746 RepID=A0A914DGD0_9BILA